MSSDSEKDTQDQTPSEEANPPVEEQPAAKRRSRKKAPAKKREAKTPDAEKPGPPEPVAEKPGPQEPAAEKPGPPEPVAEKPGPQEPAAEKPGAKPASTKRPAAKRPAAKRPAAKRPTANRAKRPPRRRVVRARARYVRTSARKARIVSRHLQGRSVEEARAILAFAPREVARDWSKLLESAVANAENNHELLEDDLVVREAYADEGPTIKRYRPRALGRATSIHKRTSHLTITLIPEA